MRLWGETLTREDALGLVGDVRQLGDATPMEFTDGVARGVRVIGVRSADGIDFDVLVDRALDIGRATVAGRPLAWQSPRGFAHGAYAEHEGFGWRRTFGGGLLTTCGLSSIGLPSVDRGEPFGLHGRISTQPAQDVATRQFWSNDDYVLEVSGRVVETILCGPTLELHRTIRTVVGVSEVEVHDIVRNTGPVKAPLMLRHHINLGFPLIRAGDRIRTSASRPEAGDRDAAPSWNSWAVVDDVTADAHEEVNSFATEPQVERAWASLTDSDGCPILTVEWNAVSMPHLVVWKHLRRRVNVLALEPSTHDDSGRASARESGALDFLEPGDSREFETHIIVNGRNGSSSDEMPEMELPCEHR